MKGSNKGSNSSEELDPFIALEASRAQSVGELERDRVSTSVEVDSLLNDDDRRAAFFAARRTREEPEAGWSDPHSGTLTPRSP